MKLIMHVDLPPLPDDIGVDDPDVGKQDLGWDRPQTPITDPTAPTGKM